MSEEDAIKKLKENFDLKIKEILNLPEDDTVWNNILSESGENGDDKSPRNLSYILSYNSILKYFSILKFDDKQGLEDLICGCHLIYGWMPTIFNLSKKIEGKEIKEKKDALSKLGTECVSIIGKIQRLKDEMVKNENYFKEGDPYFNKDVCVLRKFVNNSVVGVSKLLHFINPKIFPIWDSNICRYVIGENSKTSEYSELYALYVKKMYAIVKDEKNDKKIENLVKTVNGTTESDLAITPMRALELVMFVKGKQMREEARKNKKQVGHI